MEEGDLLNLARQGRVRFFEENEYIVWQGEPYRMQVFVIQQGSVSLWDERVRSWRCATFVEPGTCSALNS